MLKDFAKTSPVTFFALPIIIIGLLVLSYFLYSTLLNQQIDARSQYLSRQVEICIEHIDGQIAEFEQEIPNLSQIDDFEQVFDPDPLQSAKLRYRLKRLAKRYNHFVDTLFIYNKSTIYFITVNAKGELEEGYDSLRYVDMPLQFSKQPKIVHIEGTKSLAIMPTDIQDTANPVYVASLFNVFNLIESHSKLQYIGDHGYKFVFSENSGFSLAEQGEQVDFEFSLLKQHRQRVINNLLEHKKGNLIHAASNQGHVFLTAYQPFEVFAERFGLLFSVSEKDFISPIRMRLQIIFLSFFIIIGVIIVVFVINLRDISRNNEEIEASRENLAKTLTMFEAQLEKSKDAIIIADEDYRLVSCNRKAMDLFGIQERPKIGAPVQSVLAQIEPQFAESLPLLDADNKEESREEMTLKSGVKIALFSSPILDETDSLCGRMWTFRPV